MAGKSKVKKSDDSFEARMARLEKLVGKLENGELPLEEAVATFEEGVKLSKQLQDVLDTAERKIEVLLAKEGEAPVRKPFDADLEQPDEVES